MIVSLTDKSIDEKLTVDVAMKPLKRDADVGNSGISTEAKSLDL